MVKTKVQKKEIVKNKKTRCKDKEKIKKQKTLENKKW